jgi:hypothetical protein
VLRASWETHAKSRTKLAWIAIASKLINLPEAALFLISGTELQDTLKKTAMRHSCQDAFAKYFCCGYDSAVSGR